MHRRRTRLESNANSAHSVASSISFAAINAQLRPFFMSMAVAAGFGPRPRSNAFVDSGACLLARICGDIAIGFVESKHLNSRGLLHGGMISAVADGAADTT